MICGYSTGGCDFGPEGVKIFLNVLGGHGYCSLVELAYVSAYIKAHRQGRRQSLRCPLTYGFVLLFRSLAHSPQLSYAVVKRSDGSDLGFRSHGQVTGVMA